MIKLNQKTKEKLWWLLIQADYDYGRIVISDHELNDEALTLWLEDTYDIKESMEDMLEIKIPVAQFGKVIAEEKLNSYEADVIHPKTKLIHKSSIEINEAITWYDQNATPTQQEWARDAVLKQIMTNLVETECAGYDALDTAA